MKPINIFGMKCRSSMNDAYQSSSVELQEKQMAFLALLTKTSNSHFGGDNDSSDDINMATIIVKLISDMFDCLNCRLIVFLCFDLPCCFYIFFYKFPISNCHFSQKIVKAVAPPNFVPLTAKTNWL